MDWLRRSPAPLALALLLGRGPLAGASPPAAPPPRARLEMDASSVCASRDTLIARVQARSPRIELDAPPLAPLRLRATIAPDARGEVMAELIVTAAGGRRFERRLRAPSCAEATDALALVIAMTLDPSYVLDRPSAVAPPTVAPPAPAPPLPVEQVVALPAAPLPAPPAVRRFGLAAAAEILSGPAPRALPGLALLAWAALDRPSIWSPSLMVSAAHTWTTGLAEPGGTADFALDAVSVDLCPARPRLGALELAACAAGSAGRLAARGSDTFTPRSATRPFATLGGAVHLAVPLGVHLELRGRFGAGATLVRDAFEFTPRVFYRAASATLVGDLGIGLRFP